MATSYIVTWLEMSHRPPRPRLPIPTGRISLLTAHIPPVRFFRYLYDGVGSEYDWTDLHSWPEERLRAFVQDDKVEIHVVHVAGVPAAFAMLDFREAGVCDLAYFGVMPEFIGHGLGSWLLMEAIHMAWDREIERMTVNTCTLDHPRALPLYQKYGFQPVRQETRER